MSTYIDSNRIQKFVSAVEEKKKYRRDVGLILRHLFEEVGELSAAIWCFETEKECHPDCCPAKKEAVARELIDVISLANYIADVLEINLNETFPKRMKEVASYYDVDIPKGCL